MPGSMMSGSAGSQMSSASRRAKTRQYRTVAYDSQVDESLFGTSNKQKNQSNNNGEMNIEKQARERSSNKRRSAPKKEKVQVVTKDLIRELIVPSEDPSGQSTVIPYHEYLRVRDSSIVLTQQQKIAQLEAAKRAKEEAMDAANERRQFMKMQDMKRVKNEKLNDLELEEKSKREYLEARANELRQEQEDEIKYLNELILNAKCHAIRDAQTAEKDIIKKEMKSEEQRLDAMMEVDRVNAIRIQEEIEAKRKKERYLGALKIMDQIQDNEQNRLLELEKKDQENRLQQKYLDKLCEEEGERLMKKKEEQLKLREELNTCNNDILQRKEQAKEQEKVLEAKVLEYQNEKAERDAAYEAEQEKIRIEKELETAKLRAMQERARDEQAERDALRAKRAMEANEREWRRKEAIQAAKLAETEAMLKEARAQQMDEKEHFLAVQAQRERADFERVLRAQQELIEKDRREEEERKMGRTEYAKNIRTQIREKEQDKISERQKFFEEGIKLDEEARARRMKLDAIKQKKLDELREMGLGEKYVAQVARKAAVAPVS